MSDDTETRESMISELQLTHAVWFIIAGTWLLAIGEWVWVWSR